LYAVKKPQWILAGLGLALTFAIYFFANTRPPRSVAEAETHSEDDGHDHSQPASLTTDSILAIGKKQLSPEQLNRVISLENSVSRGDVQAQQLKVFHELSHFWGDSMGYFPAYAWYEAEAARLENSEKSLTFAARLFLEYLQQEPNPRLRQWEGLQAKDLFERSLKINPDNDSARVGLGACYLFGNISSAPMEGIAEIRKVLDKDSTNVYAQMMMAKGSLISGQTDKGIQRLETVAALQPDNLEAILMLADINERQKNNKEALKWYRESLKYINRADIRSDIESRIQTLSK
jgi:tetratricopeptide (TPR) repeat protein